MRTLVVSDDALDALSSRLRGSLRTLLDAQGPASADYESAEQVLLQIQAELDTNTYPTGIEVSDEELAAVHIVRDVFHGEWNYTIAPH